VPYKNKGWGLCAGELISKDTYITEYVGELFSIDSDFGEQRMDEYKSLNISYLMKTNGDEIIDALKFGNLARFINHSCDPNCET